MAEFKAELDATPLDNLFTSISQKIKQFGDQDMPAELLRWQIEDMNRKYPNVEVPEPFTAMTRIWPTSRLNLQKWPKYRTSRPVLRASLWFGLVDRMGKFMESMIKWR